MAIRVLHIDHDYVKIPLVKGGFARAVVWPGMGAKHATFNYFVMEPGQETPEHVHEQSEDVIFVLQGNAVVRDVDSGVDHPVSKGNVALVDVGTCHAVKVVGGETYIGCGGPVPHDLAFFRKAHLLP